MLEAIDTERLHMRPLWPDDAVAFGAMTNDPTIASAIDFLPTPFTPADAMNLITATRDGQDCFCGIWRRQDMSLIGMVGVHLRDGDEIEVGYWLANAMRGHGYAAEALAAVADALVEAYPDLTVFAECRPQNQVSWNLLEKVGFRADGRDGTRAGRKRLILTRSS